MTARIFAFPRPMGVPDAPRFAERTPEAPVVAMGRAMDALLKGAA